MSFSKTSVNNISTDKKPESVRLARCRKNLKDLHALQETLLTDGVDGIEKYVEDVEGDWLENWDDDNE